MVRYFGALAGLVCVSALLLRCCAADGDVEYTPTLNQNGTRCYDDFNRPQRCIPGFENAAFGKVMEVTNTCGENGPTEYCVQTGISEVRKSCDTCYPNEHSPTFLTDDSQDTPTWWQSETMLEGIQYPNQVNLTLNLGKAFDVTYVRIWFHSPRPESFTIYKRTCETCPWVPYQYYSATCRDTYGLLDSTNIARGEETRALCTSEYSDISPLKDGNIAFATLEFRPSAYNFDSSPELQEWVTATDLRISLNRLNTFGDEVFRDIKVLRSYFYAIVEVSVGARCKCNGHASECVVSNGVDGSQRRVCKCEHNTAGPDCNQCLPFYNDAPWSRASATNSHECKPCNCNGFSQRCFFDQDLYQKTGHGGHCLDCTANRDGPNCEHCKPHYYQREDQYCVACKCDPVGSRSLQCNAEGKCQCKPGVTGDKCDRCDTNHYSFGPMGCKSCGCSELGSLNNVQSCDAYTGVCACKDNVEGKRCRECKPGFFNLDAENEFGCTPCFCYGHSSECMSATGYYRYQIESTFGRSDERWRAVDADNNTVKMTYDSMTQSIGALASAANQAVYFVANERYLGDQRASYNQLLQFTLRIGENRAVPTSTDIILEGAGTYITSHIFAQDNAVPSVQSQEYKFRLHEHQIYGWSPKQSARAFMQILTDLTAIKIRATYSPEGVGFLEHVKMETASRGVHGKQAAWVEQCECPQGYVGQFCESCAPGYRHSPSLGGPFMPCIPCDCNKHADICEAETGRCICRDYTAGDNCERCARGYYGNALAGTSQDCKPCGCPNGGACIQLDDDTVCVECPTGYTGPRCDSCSDGYFGDPAGRFGPSSPCKLCDCNLNIDTNAIGNCNTTTGECLKCIHNTGGLSCDRCLSGFYGNALALPKGDCQPCRCNAVATVESEDGYPVCDQITGTCSCKPHVHGNNCDKCEEGYYDIATGDGCSPCLCNPIGSVNHTCDIATGQCFCQPGVTGLRCDQCEVHKYGFSSEGCKSCECDSIGSKDLQCDAFGQCPCLDNVEGRRCDRCKENKYDRQRQCVDCPDCYNLVRDASHRHLDKLDHLKAILDEIERNPTVIGDDNFEEQLHDVQDKVAALSDMAKTGAGGEGKTLAQKVNDISDRHKEISRVLGEIEENVYLAKEQDNLANQDITHTQETLKSVDEILEDAIDSLNTEGKTRLDKAREAAKGFGQHSDKMTQITQQARELADNLDVQANDIVATATEAKSRATETYELAKNATDQQKNVSNELRSLRSEIGNAEVKRDRVKELTTDAHNRSSEAKIKALTLLNEVEDLAVPDIDVAKLRQDAEDAKTESRRLFDEANRGWQTSEDLLRRVEEQLKLAEELLKKGSDQEDLANELLNDFYFMKTAAESAVHLANNTFNDARNRFISLSQSDKQVQESKAEADKALQRIPAIEEHIEEATAQTESAEQLLGRANETASSALESAKSAGSVAKLVSQKAAELHSEADLLDKNATNLKNEVGLMADRVANTEREFLRLQHQTHSNETLIEEAKEKVGRAQKDSQEATKKVADILRDVEDIMKELDNLPDFDEDELVRLEQQLNKAEQKIADAKLDEILKERQWDQKEHNALVEEYRVQIAQLEKDVANAEQIARSLPDGCYKKFVLEP